MSRIIRGRAKLVEGKYVKASGEAEGVIADAEKRAREIIDEALKEAEVIQKQALAEGREQGHADAAAVLMRAAQARDRALAQVQDTMVSIALKAAKRVVRDVFAIEPARITQTVQELLERTARATKVTLRVHSQDVRYVEDLTKEGYSFVLTPDDTLLRGECVVESNLGDLDARFDVQLASLEKALREQDI